MKDSPKILVVGSFVMDLIVTTPKFPNTGETVLGTDFTTAPGGKGANQAIQAARLGSQVTMIGKLGTDSFGNELLSSMAEAGVDIGIGHKEALLKANQTAAITVSRKGAQPSLPTLTEVENFIRTRYF